MVLAVGPHPAIVLPAARRLTVPKASKYRQIYRHLPLL